MSGEESGGLFGATRAAVAGGVATAAVMGGMGAWLADQRAASHEIALATLERTHEGELVSLRNAHDDALRVQERGKEEALTLLREELEGKIVAARAELAAARAEARGARADAADAQAETIRALTSQVAELKGLFALYADTDGKAVVFDFDRIYGPVVDRDLSARHAQLYDGRVYAIKRFEGAPAARLAQHRLLEGTVAKFLTMAGPALDVAAYEDPDSQARRYETFWQLGETETMQEARGAFHRMAPHVSVRRYAPDEIGSQNDNKFAAGKPELFLFLQEFNGKMEHATRANLPLQVRRLRQEGALYFAHFRTRLNDVMLDGVFHDRLFVHELLLTAPTREGVFVFKGAFTSKDPHYAKSRHWPQVSDWWLNLRINPI